jgi:hypothetical protein
MTYEDRINSLVSDYYRNGYTYSHVCSKCREIAREYGVPYMTVLTDFEIVHVELNYMDGERL